jgi:imidazolonepropionase-like amidohydrolase
MKKIFLSLGGLLLGTILTYGQANIVPAKAQTQSIAIVGATIHVGNGQVIENGYITFSKGKITGVGSGTASADVVIDAKGKQLYPGFICPITTLGLVEVEEGARGTVDEAETGDQNPHVRTLIAFNTDSKVIPTVRSNGILLAQPSPTGGGISGESSVVQLDAWNWEDAAYKKDIAIHLTWPAARAGGRRGGGGRGALAVLGAESPAERAQKALDQLDSYFAEAKAYSEVAKPAVANLRFEAMRGLFNGTKKLFVNADGVKEMQQAIAFAKKFGMDEVIVGGKESYLITSLLKENNIPIIIKETQALPDKEDDDVYLPYRLPKLLQDAGVMYGLTGIGFWRQRNLPFEAGQAVGFGLTKEQALSMITLNNAKILGIDKTTGTLEVGKDANLFLSTGDALDMISLNVEKAYIQGRDINLDNLHKQLYKKFSDKYGLKP